MFFLRRFVFYFLVKVFLIVFGAVVVLFIFTATNNKIYTIKMEQLQEKSEEVLNEPFTHNFKEGDRISHQRFGDGTLESFLNKHVCHVVFDSGEEKDLLLKFAKLKLI